MYAEIKTLAGRTKYGTYKSTSKYDKEKLVWDQWIDIGECFYVDAVSIL